MYNSLLSLLSDCNVLYDSGNLNPNAVIILNTNTQLLEDVILSTSFLPKDTTIRERLYCITHNIIERLLCPVCGSPLAIKTSGRLEYPTYCSRSCMYKCPERTQKKNNTMVDRYGVKYTAQNDTLKQKMQTTCIEKYGVGNPFKSKIIQADIKQTVNDRYGVDNVMQDVAIATKQKAGCDQKDYPAISEKIKATTHSNNGYYNILQHHLTEYQLHLLNDKDWLTEHHVIKKLTLGEIAGELGVEQTIIGLKCKEFNIPVSRFSRSVGEKQVLEFLERDACVDVIQGDRTVLGGKELDLYIPTHHIAIEYCGLYWHADIHTRIDNKYHQKKHEVCKKQGIQLITLYEDEWYKKQDQVKSKLKSLLGKDDRTKVYARQTTVVDVAQQDKVNFFESFHIQGSGPGSITIGLQNNHGELVACMCFVQHGKVFYLNRYATSHRVIGGFSKLVKYFQQHYNWESIVSFADLRWSDGAMYGNNGWILDKTIPPDYYYSPNGKDRYHKSNYRRKMLATKLSDFDPLLSERVNCNNHGILRIWDCGKLRYVMCND